MGNNNQTNAIISKVRGNVNKEFFNTCKSQIESHAAVHKIINNKATFEKARKMYQENKNNYNNKTNTKALKETIFSKFAHEWVEKVPKRFNDEMIIIEPMNSTDYTKETSNKNTRPLCSSARMNASHIMVIPRTPIWNALSLKPKHIPLLEKMMKYGKKYIEDVEKEKNNVKNIKGEIRYAFHVHPNNSVPYLHMHVWKDNNNTVIRSMDYKNLDVEVVLDVLREERKKNLPKNSNNFKRLFA